MESTRPPSSEEAQKPLIKKEFPLTNLALRNKTTIALLAIMMVIFGSQTYVDLPKDSYPDIKINQVYVGTPYPGNSPLDIENLITRPIEQEINTISEVDKITSATVQDYSTIIVEFPPKMDIQEALVKVKDAVDKSKPELPTDLDQEPNVFEFDFAELPILNINLSGDFSPTTLKEYAERLEERIERISEVSKVEIRGIEEKEVQILLDPYKMDAVKVSYKDIEDAIRSENINMSGGNVLDGGLRRSIRVLGEMENPEVLKGVVVKHEDGDIVHLEEIATVVFDYKEEKNTYARLNGHPVVSVDVIKRSGENLLLATDKIFRELENIRKNLPANLHITITNDQSTYTRDMVKNLENNIISGVILVVLVLLCFLGTRNALFVGMAIPLSMLISFIVLRTMDATVNMMVLFSLIMALGMLVDNGIVVVENTYRLLEKGLSPLEATKRGVGGVALPIITSTLTTLAAFIPLALWPGIVGEFMKYLPITLIITLSSSLFVALVINPVFLSMFIKDESNMEINVRKVWRTAGWLTAAGVLLLVVGLTIGGNILILFALLVLLNIYVLRPFSRFFQDKILPHIESLYKRVLSVSLNGRGPYFFFGGTVSLLILAFFFFTVFTPKVIFFPINQPSLVNTFVSFPIGTDIETTNTFSKKIETQIIDHLEPYAYMVKSVVAKVGAGASDPGGGFGVSGNEKTPHKALITVSFEDFKYRKGVLTSDVMESIRALVAGYPGVSITVDKDQAGPPVGKPVSIELMGEDFEVLIAISERMKAAINDAGIGGIEALKLDVEKNKPEIVIDVDKEKARRYGLSTFKVADEIRTSLFGKEVSKYKEGEDDYEIHIRLGETYRHNLRTLMDKSIVFRNPGSGGLLQVPISSVAKASYSNTYSRVNRKDLDRLVTLSSNVLGDHNPTEVNNQIRTVLADFDMPLGYRFRFGGEQEKQKEELAFLSRALIIALFAIFLIIITQFNRLVSPIIIMTTVFFSLIGVLFGLVIFQMDFIIIMTMIGIISLAGIVVNNAIVLLDFIETTQKQKRLDLGAQVLPFPAVVEAIIEAGKIRLRPVLLTAITTILGLLPLAVGLNIDFIRFFSEYNPDFYLGGDSVIFWGPMSWTIIFGLAFATFLTLVIVPVMYWFYTKMIYKWKKWA